MRSISPIARETARARFSFRSLSITAVLVIGVCAIGVFSAGSAAAGLRSFVFGLISNSGSAIPQSAVPKPITFEAEYNIEAAAAPVVNGNLQLARSGHTATRLDDGRVLIVGGEPTGANEIFDPVSNTSVSTGSLSVPRSGATATLARATPPAVYPVPVTSLVTSDRLAWASMFGV